MREMSVRQDARSAAGETGIGDAASERRGAGIAELDVGGRGPTSDLRSGFLTDGLSSKASSMGLTRVMAAIMLFSVLRFFDGLRILVL